MSELTLFDGLHARAGDPDTSKAAADSVSSILGPECQRVLDVVQGLGYHGATALDVQQNLRASYGVLRDQNVCARRLSDLRDAGLVRDSGRRRKGRTNRLLIVWELTK